MREHALSGTVRPFQGERGDYVITFGGLTDRDSVLASPCRRPGYTYPRTRKMQNRELANQLRQRLREVEASLHLLITSPDDILIEEYYNTCSCCGESMVNSRELQRAIRLATSEEHFLQLIDCCSEPAEPQPDTGCME